MKVNDAVEAQFGSSEDELWWPATITQVWSNGDVDVLYDDGDVERQKPRCRVRPLRASAAKRLEGCVLRHPRHSHVAFLVGKGHGRGAASAALGGAKLAMVEEGLFAHEESGVPLQEHAHVSSIAEP